VLLLRTDDGYGLDIALGAMPFEQHAIERSSNVELVPGADLAELKESPELLDELERIARRAEAVIGAFPRAR
jgi:hypothetical protein